METLEDATETLDDLESQWMLAHADKPKLRIPLLTTTLPHGINNEIETLTDAQKHCNMREQ